MQIFSEVAFSADTPLHLPSCHFGPESEHIAQGSLIYTFTNTCWCLLTALRNVDRRPESLTGSGEVGWAAVGQGWRGATRLRQPSADLMDLILAHKLQATAGLFISVDILRR